MAIPREIPPLKAMDPAAVEVVAGAAAGGGESGHGEGRKGEKKDKIGSRRGIETLFRSVYQVHINLTTLADSKANFLISVNTFVMLLVVAHGVTYVHDTVLYIPVAIVLFACTGSIIFAVLSARPRISKEGLTDESGSGGGLNLLFFGHFSRLSKDRFESEIQQVLRKRPLAYSLMAGDHYEMGQVLNRKYRLLRCAYSFLLYGLPAGTILFLALRILVLREKP